MKKQAPLFLSMLAVLGAVLAMAATTTVAEPTAPVGFFSPPVIDISTLTAN